MKTLLAVAILAGLAACLQAQTPAALPTLPTTCPYTYQTIENDTYCIISTKTGVSVASLMAANPTIPLNGVTAGETFTIPCKPEQNCCPFYLYAAPNGTGRPLFTPASFINIVETVRPDLTVAELAEANPDNVNTTTSFVRCGFNVKVPCIPGSPICTGVGYTPAPAPAQIAVNG